jgi:hypothetical protein
MEWNSDRWSKESLKSKKIKICKEWRKKIRVEENQAGRIRKKIKGVWGNQSPKITGKTIKARGVLEKKIRETRATKSEKSSRRWEEAGRR